MEKRYASYLLIEKTVEIFHFFLSRFFVFFVLILFIDLSLLSNIFYKIVFYIIILDINRII